MKAEFEILGYVIVAETQGQSFELCSQEMSRREYINRLRGRQDQ